MKFFQSLLALALVFLCFSGAGVSRAERGKSAIEISPSFADVTLGKETGSAEAVFKITNLSEKEIALKISFIDLGTLDESGGLAFQGMQLGKDNLGDKYPLARWSRLDQNELKLEPGQSENSKVTFMNDDALTPGGHYGAFLAQIIAGSGEEKSSNFSIKSILAAPVFLKKEGGEIYDLAIEMPKTKEIHFSFPEKMGINFVNKGNVHLVPRGVISVKNFFGQTVFRAIINPESRYVFPGSSRIISNVMKKSSGFRLSGPYEMQISYHYDGKQKNETKTIKFLYVSPIQAGLVLLLTIFAFGSILYRLIIKAPKKGQNGTNYAQKDQ